MWCGRPAQWVERQCLFRIRYVILNKILIVRGWPAGHGLAVALGYISSKIADNPGPETKKYLTYSKITFHMPEAPLLGSLNPGHDLYSVQVMAESILFWFYGLWSTTLYQIINLNWIQPACQYDFTQFKRAANGCSMLLGQATMVVTMKRTKVSHRSQQYITSNNLCNFLCIYQLLLYEAYITTLR